MRKGEKKKKEPLELVDCRTELKREIGLDIGDKGIFIPDEGKA